MRLWELARYAFDNAWRSRLRTALTVAGIAIASGALVSMVGFILGLREQLEIPIRQLGLFNNIEVDRLIDPKPGEESPILDEKMLAEIESLDGVDYAYPDLRLSNVNIRHGEFSDDCFAVGVMREAGLTGITSELLEVGKFFSLGGGNEIIIGSGLLDNLGFPSAEAAVGQQIELTAGGLVRSSEKNFERQEETMRLEVVGVFTPPEFGIDLTKRTLLLPVDLMRHMPSSWMETGISQLRAGKGEIQRGYTRIIVRAENVRDVMPLEEKLRDMGFATLSVLTRMEDAKRFFVFMEVLLTAVGTVALVVAGLGILNTLTMTVMERFQEIGIYKSIGASKGDIRWMFLVEAATVGLLGGIAGLLLARVVSWILAWAFNAYAASSGVEGPDAVFEFPLWLLAGAVFYSVVISVVSGLYPASKAARIDPIAALRRG